MQAFDTINGDALKVKYFHKLFDFTYERGKNVSEPTNVELAFSSVIGKKFDSKSIDAETLKQE